MWFTYILLCIDNSYYIGISNDPEKRFQDHKNGKGGRYTRSHKPTKIVYTQEFQTKSEALKREIEIKKLSKKEKQKLIENNRAF